MDDDESETVAAGKSRRRRASDIAEITDTDVSAFDERQWRQFVVDRFTSFATQIHDISDTSKANAQQVVAALSIHAANATQLANNTDLTIKAAQATTDGMAGIRQEISELKLRVEPTVALHDNLKRGGELVGKAADFIEKWGKRLFVLGVWLAGTVLFFKLLLSGWLDYFKTIIQSVPPPK